MTCVKCDAAEMVEQIADLTADVKGERLLVPKVSALVCPECGNKAISGHEMQEYMRAAADIYRRKHSLLTSSEIKERRERLNQSQEEFAHYLDVGVASIKRWDLGQVQDRAMDKLIRVLTDAGEAFNNYKQVERLLAPKHH